MQWCICKQLQHHNISNPKCCNCVAALPPRHHNPLQFSQAALCDLLDASWLWFQESHKLNPHAAHPFLL